MKAKISIAREKDSRNVKHISEVSNGLACNCICLKCSSELIAANNGQKQIPHFRHKHTTNCDGSPETGLHLLAKQIISESNSIRISNNIRFNYSECLVEKFLFDIVPDIQLKDEHGNLWIVEVFVTHKVDQKKLSKIKGFNLNCLEIDLSNVDRHISKEDLKILVLEELQCKAILNETINRSKEIEEKHIKLNRPSDSDGLFSIVLNVLFLVGIFLVGRFFVRRILGSYR